MSTICIYIFSTYEDLREYCEAVHNALHAEFRSKYEIV